MSLLSHKALRYRARRKLRLVAAARAPRAAQQPSWQALQEALCARIPPTAGDCQPAASGHAARPAITTAAAARGRWNDSGATHVDV